MDERALLFIPMVFYSQINDSLACKRYDNKPKYMFIISLPIYKGVFRFCVQSK